MVRPLFWARFPLAELFCKEGKFSDAQTHIERVESHAVNDPYVLARASWLQAKLWDEQHTFEEAKSEALRALDVLEKLAAANDAEEVERFLEGMDRNARGNASSG